MTWLRTGATTLLASALTLGTGTARADSYCFHEACAYVGEIGIVIGGVASIVGSTGSIFDEQPDSLWYGLGYGFGSVNMVVGGIMVAVGAGIEEEDDDGDALIAIGATQAGLGAFALFMAALAEGHYDSIDRASGRASAGTSTRASLAPIVVPMVDPNSGVPSGAMLSATF
jgi:hypothetical protein